jgi:hypothetical protein
MKMELIKFEHPEELGLPANYMLDNDIFPKNGV